MSVEEEPSDEREKTPRKQVTFCEEGKLTESLGASSSWETEVIHVRTIIVHCN